MKRSNSRKWAEFRFAVVGRLIFAKLNKNELTKEIKQLSNQKWKDPISGEPKCFGHSSIERWYYIVHHAIDEGKSPIDLFDKTRSDIGSFSSLTKEQQHSLKILYKKHKNWTYQNFYSYICRFSKKHVIDQPPSYATIRRYIIKLKSLDTNNVSNEINNVSNEIEKAHKLIQHLRKTLIINSSQSFILRSINEKLSRNFHSGLQFICLKDYEKKYLLDAHEKYRRAVGKSFSFYKEIGRGECTIARWRKNIEKHGIGGLIDKRTMNNNHSTEITKKHYIEKKKKTDRLIEILHHQPFYYNINRSNWSGKSLAQAYEQTHNESISSSTVGRHLKNSGHFLKRAKTVLMSSDPDYQEKVETLLLTLQKITDKEMLFFIDEMGPLRVKK